MRLIDADALTKEIKMDIEDVGLQERMIFHRINDAPTIDAVPVVRCKDCKYAHMTYSGECKYCDMWKEDGEALYLDGDFFCAYGERKEP